MNKSIALFAILAASATTAKCDPDYECTLYDEKYLLESNGYYSFCLDDKHDSTAYSFVSDNVYGTFKPELLTSYQCGPMVAIDFCIGVPYQTTDPSADYTYSCNDGELLFQSDGYGAYESEILKYYDGLVKSIVLYGYENNQSCEPAIYLNSGCEAGMHEGGWN